MPICFFILVTDFFKMKIICLITHKELKTWLHCIVFYSKSLVSEETHIKKCTLFVLLLLLSAMIRLFFWTGAEFTQQRFVSLWRAIWILNNDLL